MTFEARQRRRQRAVRALRDALSSETQEAWHDMPLVMGRLLAEEERTAMAWALLKSLPEEMAEEVCKTCAGEPLPHLTDNARIDARWWARLATAKELKAYAAETFRAMSPRDRQRFLRWTKGNRA